jgi:hypothetical protein
MTFSKNEMQPKQLQTPNEKSARLRLKCGMFHMKVIKIQLVLFFIEWNQNLLTFL